MSIKHQKSYAEISTVFELIFVYYFACLCSRNDTLHRIKTPICIDSTQRYEKDRNIFYFLCKKIITFDKPLQNEDKRPTILLTNHKNRKL